MNVMSMATTRGNVAVNQYVIRNGCKLGFQSYRTYCAEYDESAKTLILFEGWDYSRTTQRYLLQFLRVFVGMDIHSTIELKKNVFIDNVAIAFDKPFDSKVAA